MLKDASSLAFFRVSNLPFSDCFLKLHRLTHLELSCTYVWPRNYLVVMAANPMLEVAILRIPGEWDLVPYGPLAIEPIIVFVPHLRQLEVYGEFVEQILGEFALPPGIHLSCDYIDGYIYHTRIICRSFPQSRNCTSCSPWTKESYHAWPPNLDPTEHSYPVTITLN